MEMIQQECVVKMEQVVNANVNMRPLSEDNPFHCTMRKDSDTRVKINGVWCIYNENHAFLIDETRVREEHEEYDV